MNKVNIDAYVSEIRGNRARDLSDKITVSADYESANTCSAITFQVPIDQAPLFYIGQQISIVISW